MLNTRIDTEYILQFRFYINILTFFTAPNNMFMHKAFILKRAFRIPQ